MRRDRTALRVALAAWAEARLYVLAAYIVTTAVVNRLEPPPVFAPVSDGLLAWDGRWYEAIAVGGYEDAADAALRFFPLWPLVGRALAVVPGLDAGAALVVAANVAAVAVGVGLHRVVLDETGDRALARRSVRLMALAPPSFVLVLAYSEALYITLALAVFAAAGRRRWWAAALGGYLAGLTRPVGALLALPVAMAALQHRDGRRLGRAVAAVAPVAGAATFAVWSLGAFGDATAPMDPPHALRGLAGPASPLVRAAWRGVNGDTGELLHFLAGVLLVALAVVVATKLSRPMALYAVPSVVLMLAADNLNSMERYALSAFPLVIAAAVVSRHRWLDRWAVGASGAGMVCLTILALGGVYVP